MGNVIDDMRSSFDDFGMRAFNEVDSLVLSQLAYARMPAVVPHYPSFSMVPLQSLLRAESYDAMFNRVWSPQANVELVRAMCENPRWRDVRVGGYVSESDPETAKQFSASTFDLGDGLLYIAFRGTDSSIVGWKEDFMMAFRRPVAAQEAAARYVREVAAHWHGLIMLGGHSKGGNLAVYAAAVAPEPIQDRIIAVYSHDGPGFDESFMNTPGFARMAGRIHKTVPSSSIIGMLFEPRADTGNDHAGYTVVASDGIGIMQHFALNWQVRDGAFEKTPGLSQGAEYLADVINGWMNRYDDERRRLFIENLFTILESGGYDTFGELSAHWRQTVPMMVQAARGVDPEEREAMIAVVGGLVASALKPGEQQTEE
ncbi:DUF2974 domain-containing protein [Bifidobacterium callimiconis]|uniref:DUF2974 domain-containing protein n=1 Tax=Bifidobacterium callimiconis TaxID=2306973 RepID=A0A430F9B2_9BIFI|nr:DUF2974 domain-containing protein [Bifidobacterium callimiconis]MBT1177992.1 DUF2974 domain-containing protein [Bifidobacterium callimiconis]RSX49411.1 hypothetical protein D2E23_2104 [Bifidobacterium callimiconis]